ncbi:hypothetical protein P3W45_001802 [Vairimorpha bombi]
MYRILISLYTVTETDFISAIKRNELNFFYDLKKPICSRPLLKIIHKGMEEKKELSREFILITQIEKLLSLKWSVLVKSAFLAFPFYKTSEQFHYAITNLKKNVVKRNTRIRDLLIRVVVYDPLKETIYKTLDYNFEVENLKELYTELFNIGRNNYVECDQNEIYITCYNKFRKKLNEEGQDCSEFIPGVLRSINDYEPIIFVLLGSLIHDNIRPSRKSYP